jgi:hypothetical protein
VTGELLQGAGRLLEFLELVNQCHILIACCCELDMGQHSNNEVEEGYMDYSYLL